MPIIVLPTVLLVILLITCYLVISPDFQLTSSLVTTSLKTQISILPNKYITKYQEELKEAYELAVQRSKNRKMKDKGRRDRGACFRPLYPGDRILIRNLP